MNYEKKQKGVPFMKVRDSINCNAITVYVYPILTI